MPSYTKVFSQQTEFFTAEDPKVVFRRIVDLVNNSDSVCDFDAMDKSQCDESKLKLKFKMSGTTNTNTDWAIKLQVQFYFVDSNKICVKFFKKAGCVIAYYLQY